MFSEKLSFLDPISLPNGKLHGSQLLMLKNVASYVFRVFKMKATRKASVLKESSHGLAREIYKMEPSKTQEPLI